MNDTRPLHSPMPPLAAQVGQELIEQLKPMLDRAFERVIGQPGDADQLENDALSVLANVASFVAMQLTARLMLLKTVDVEVGAAVALRDVGDRLFQHLNDFARSRGPIL